MIFVTVGTHEQQFNRLCRCIDELKGQKIIMEDVVIQTGYSTYVPQYCEWKAMYSYSEITKLFDDARIILTHGGPSSFMAALQRGKTPIVIPRQKEFDEHVNDHQVNFCRTVAERYGNIIVVEDISSIQDLLIRYDEVVSQMQKSTLMNNNETFCKELKVHIDELFG